MYLSKLMRRCFRPEILDKREGENYPPAKFGANLCRLQYLRIGFTSAAFESLDPITGRPEKSQNYSLRYILQRVDLSKCNTPEEALAIIKEAARLNRSHKIFLGVTTSWVSDVELIPLDMAPRTARTPKYLLDIKVLSSDLRAIR